MAKLKFITFQFKDSNPAVFAAVDESVCADIIVSYTSPHGMKSIFSDIEGNTFAIDLGGVRSIVIKDYIVGKGAHS